MKTLKEKLNAKLSKNGGFTLVEMLIVVAIIAILVAVSIPIVNGALDNARKATDDANERAAKAAGAIFYLTKMSDGTWSDADAKAYPYDAVAGELSTTKAAADITPYGKVSTNTKNIVQVTIDTKGNVTTTWVPGKP